jgi:CelD/BcsL family acetyltransferase involved in cellulose biosynthesis
MMLVHEQGPGGGRIRPLSAPHAEYVRVVGPGAEQPAVTAALAGALDDLAEGGDRVVVSDLPVTSALGRHFAATPPWKHTEARCAVVPLPVDWAAMSRSTRKTHNRRQRAVDELIADGRRLVFRRSRSAEELRDGYRVLVDLHRRQWSPDLVLPDADLRHTADTWEQVVGRCGPGLAFVATMELDGVAVAAQLCLYRDTRSFSLRPAMHPDHRSLSPGHALLRRLTDELTASGFTEFDLGRTLDSAGQTGYKSQYLARWTDTITATSAATHRQHVRAAPRPAVIGDHVSAVDLATPARHAAVV